MKTDLEMMIRKESKNNDRRIEHLQNLLSAAQNFKVHYDGLLSLYNNRMTMELLEDECENMSSEQQVDQEGVTKPLSEICNVPKIEPFETGYKTFDSRMNAVVSAEDKDTIIPDSIKSLSAKECIIESMKQLGKSNIERSKLIAYLIKWYPHKAKTTWQPSIHAMVHKSNEIIEGPKGMLTLKGTYEEILLDTVRQLSGVSAYVHEAELLDYLVEIYGGVKGKTRADWGTILYTLQVCEQLTISPNGSVSLLV